MSTVKQLREEAEEAIEALYSACERDVEKLETKVSDLEEDLQDAKYSMDVIRENYGKPAWGNCRNGCEPSYLDGDGYCSPGCRMGGSRGQLYSMEVRH